MLKITVSGCKFNLGDQVIFIRQCCSINGTEYEQKELGTISGRTLTHREFSGRKKPIIEEMYIVKSDDPPVCKDGSKIDESFFMNAKKIKLVRTTK